MIRVRPSYSIIMYIYGLLQLESLVKCNMSPKSTPRAANDLRSPYEMIRVDVCRPNSGKRAKGFA